MLRAVGNPVAVNPDAELAKLAADEGWRIMRFEKLGRRLAIGGATLAAAASGTLLATRHRQSARRLRARSSRASPLSEGWNRTLVTFDVYRTSKVISVARLSRYVGRQPRA